MASHSEVECTQLSRAQRNAVIDEMNRVLADPTFKASKRCVALLRRVVDYALAESCANLKERVLGFEVFGRDADYDTAGDPVVRMTANDIRKRLALYYRHHDHPHVVTIDLPRGSYAPEFDFCAPNESIESVDGGELNSLSGPSGPLKLSGTPITRTTRLCKLPDSPLRRKWFRGIAAMLPLPAFHSSEQPEVISVLTAHDESESDVIAPPRKANRWIWFLLAGALVLSITTVTWLRVRSSQEASGFDVFWAPVLSSPQPALISVGEMRASEIDIAPNGLRNRFSRRWTIVNHDQFPSGTPVQDPTQAREMARVAAFFGAKNKMFDMKEQSNTTLADISSRPTVLIGSYDNDWSIRMTDQMRFRFEIDFARHLTWISDRKRPTEKIGPISMASNRPVTLDAYAIVARGWDPISHQPYVISTGNSDVGCGGSSEFISNPRYLNEFWHHAPAGWANKNLEFLVQVPVVENVVGVPRIIEYVVW